MLINLARIGIQVTDENTISDSLWAFAYIVESCDDDVIERVAQADVLHVMCQSLNTNISSLYTPSVKALGSILTSND